MTWAENADSWAYPTESELEFLGVGHQKWALKITLLVILCMLMFGKLSLKKMIQV